MKRLLLEKSFVFIALLLMFASCTTTRSIAIEEGWELLGERKVNFLRDKDDINVTSRNEFTALRFKVEKQDIRLNYLKIHFRNGDVLQPAVDVIINANQNSQVIELARDGRPIDKVEFKYHTTGSNVLEGRANVLLFGKKYYPGGY